MPGIGLGCGLHLCQALELRQKLELRVQLTLQQVLAGQFDTDDGKSARCEAEVLVKILHDIDAGVYADVSNFIDRVGKRVPKVKRTDATRLLITQVRALSGGLEADSVVDVRRVVAWGHKVHERFALAPTDEYARVINVLVSKKCVGVEARRAFWNLFEANLESDDGSVNLHSLMEDLVGDARLGRDVVENLPARFASLGSRAINVLAHDLIETLPEHVDADVFGRAQRIIVEDERLLGHLALLGRVRLYRSFVGTEDRFAAQPKIPEILRPYLPADLPAELLQKLEEFFDDKPLRDSIDALRDVLRAFIVFEREKDGREYLVHFLTHADSAKSIVRVAREVGVAATWRTGDFVYPLDAKNADEVIAKLRGRGFQTFYKNLGLRAGYSERFAEASLRWPGILPQIILKLTDIYATHSPDILPVLARIVEAMIDGKFGDWRYEHDAATAQLAPVRASSAWRENIWQHCILGQVDAVTSRLRAVGLLEREAAAVFRREYGKDWTRELGGELEREIMTLEDRLRNPEPHAERKYLGITVKKLRNEYRAARMIELFDLNPNQVELVRSSWQGMLRETWTAPFQEVVSQALAILNEPIINDVKIIEVRETDNLTDLLQVGVIPVLSCQRWTEVTGYNKCLLAYVADPNKKLWQVKTRRGEVIGRVVVRLLPFKKSALVLVEPPYSIHWSGDYTKAVFSAILQKCAKLAEALGKPVCVGYIGARRWGEWGKMFDVIGKECGFEPKSCNFRPKLPESFNLWEYSDSMGGCLPRGKSFEKEDVMRLTYIVVGDENEGDDSCEDE